MTAEGLRYVTGLRCTRCGATCALADDVYTCAACGGNLQVEYDYRAIRRTWTKDAVARTSDLTIWRFAPTPGPANVQSCRVATVVYRT